MADFASIALNIFLALSHIDQSNRSIGSDTYGKLLYEVRSVARAKGLGGSPAYCVQESEDAILMVYTVRNNNDYSVSAQAAPPLILLNPGEIPVKSDQLRTDALEGKLSPNLTIRGGRMEAGQIVVRAQVFITPKNSTRDFTWKFRVAPPTTLPVLLPLPRDVPVAECT
jgi:hypothetical protein